jgi:hypothetical protein
VTVFLDANVVIYFVERHPVWGPKATLHTQLRAIFRKLTSVFRVARSINVQETADSFSDTKSPCLQNLTLSSRYQHMGALDGMQHVVAAFMLAVVPAEWEKHFDVQMKYAKDRCPSARFEFASIPAHTDLSAKLFLVGMLGAPEG